MRFPSITKSGRSKAHNPSWVPDQAQQHPDLPLQQQRPTQPQHQPQHSSPRSALNRSRSVIERPHRVAAQQAGDRRSIATFIPSGDLTSPSPSPSPSPAYSPDDIVQLPPTTPTGGLSRSQTVFRREVGGAATGSASANHASSYLYSPSPLSATDPSPENYPSPTSPPAQTWSPDFTQLPTSQEQHEVYIADHSALMSGASQHSGKTSSETTPQAALDRWSQRRLQRLNTEQGFREQRQGGHVTSPPLPTAVSDQQPSSVYNNPPSSDAHFAQPQSSLQHTSAQPHHSQQGGYSQPSRVQANTNLGLAIQTSSSSRSAQYSLEQQSHLQQYPSPDPSSHYTSSQDPRPPLSQSRSFSQTTSADDSSSMSNNGSMSTPKAIRTGNGNRQSLHNGIASREGSHSTQGGQIPAFNASIVPPGNQGQPYKTSQQPQQGDVGRGTPQPLQVGDEMSDEDIVALVKDHKELREKYTKVKKYYFEKEDQVKQLQNSLAHQRLSQSRTSLDDSEYTTRFNRLDGLIAQLAFSIRKSWKSIPAWLVNSANRDAVQTGKQEMTAAGRAVISNWLVEEVFDKYFHPDLDVTLSEQLKMIQKNMRKFAPLSQTAEEEDYLTAKVVNWRLATLEGLQDLLRSPKCPENRQKLTDTLKDKLVAALAVHLQDPPPSDLEGGVHMIVELVVSIAIHLPLESRDVVIEYFQPGYSIMPEQMKLESGIPPLSVSVAEDAAERASMKSATSDLTDVENSNSDQPSKKRSMLSALTGTGGKSKAQGKHTGAAGSSSSLTRPGSSQDMKEDSPPRVRMAAGIGVQVRGRSVLVKAPVFST